MQAKDKRSCVASRAPQDLWCGFPRHSFWPAILMEDCLLMCGATCTLSLLFYISRKKGRPRIRSKEVVLHLEPHMTYEYWIHNVEKSLCSKNSILVVSVQFIKLHFDTVILFLQKMCWHRIKEVVLHLEPHTICGVVSHFTLFAQQF